MNKEIIIIDFEFDYKHTILHLSEQDLIFCVGGKIEMHVYYYYYKSPDVLLKLAE